MPTPKTVVIGLDGAHFEVIQPWLDEGKLPNIKRAIESGVSADMESVLPPVTSPNWKSYATGKNPGKFGIFWWENIDVKNQRIYYPSGRKNKTTQFWELIGEHEPVGVLGVPTTYPPRSVNGFLISGAPDGGSSGYTYPTSLEQRLENEYDYKITKQNRLGFNRDAAVEEILELIDSRFTVAKSLDAEYDVSFLQITTFYLNSLHHFLWDDDATLRGWQIVDEHVGAFLNEETNLVLMSDHGSNKIETVFNINSWLQQEGYLTVNTGISEYLHKVGLTKERLIRLAYFLCVANMAERVAPDALLDRLPNNEGELTRESKMNVVNWNRSTALGSGQGLIYLLQDPASGDYEQIRSKLIRKLEKLKDPAGRPIATDVRRGEDFYSGQYLKEAPDIIIDQRNGVHIAGSVGGNNSFTTPKDERWSAENKRQGLFVASGPSFSKSGSENLSILDLAPTLLHLHGCNIPKDMDGSVNKWVFAEGTFAKRRDIEYTSKARVENEIKCIRQIARESDL